jgi:NADPH-dependent 2,4-dienoyl-CoA reductase/sulfur reductase-like enzyme
MTWTPNRRAVIGGLGLGALATLTPTAFAQAAPKLVIIGGGFGGATAARQLKHLIPNADVTLIEPNATYASCPFSNLVVSGDRDLSAQLFRYDALRAEGIRLIHTRASDVNADAREITLDDGVKLAYDRLVLSPGVDMRWNAIEGYDADAANRLPHAWKAGAQTTLLRDQLRAMDDGGRVVMTAPPAPYRCPPGPYERASLIAHYLKTEKPKSKLIILDAKDDFSKMPLFQAAWALEYPEHLEWRSASNDGRVSRVDAETMTVSTDFEDITAAVINVIPPQKAGAIADAADVTDATGWCPIDPITFESTRQENIHVIGDATIAAPMPKSAFSANLQGKLCAIAIADILAGRTPQTTILANTCYSYTTPTEAVSIVGVYDNAGGAFTRIEGAGGLSPLDGSTPLRQSEAAEATAWFRAVTGEAFG